MRLPLGACVDFLELFRLAMLNERCKTLTPELTLVRIEAVRVGRLIRRGDGVISRALMELRLEFVK
jgi:hypothetical protein